jgi:hypothetical protein
MLRRKHSTGRWLLLSILLLSATVAKAGDGKKADGSTAAPAPPPTFWSRHIQFLAFEGGLRYRYIDKAPSQITTRDQQYKISAKVKLDLVPEGRTYLQFRSETGSSFASSWTNSGIGLGRRTWAFNVKSFFLGQKFGKHIEAQFGGLEYDQGAGSEATYTDNDGWLVGYRARVTTSGRGWLPDKFSVTAGYVGDLKTPSVYSRFHRMGDLNYFQVLAQKKFGKNREASAEFDSIEEISYARGAFRWKNVPARVFDEVLVEAITRANRNAAFGWSATLSKTFDAKSQWRAALLYSDIPTQVFNKTGQQILLNGDAIVLGKHGGAAIRFNPAKDLELSVLGSRKLDHTPNAARWLGQVMVRYQFAGMLNRLLR